MCDTLTSDFFIKSVDSNNVLSLKLNLKSVITFGEHKCTLKLFDGNQTSEYLVIFYVKCGYNDLLQVNGEFEYDVPIAEIISISNRGLVTVDFGVKMVIPENITLIPIEAVFMPGPYSEPVNMTFEIVKFEGKQLQI